MQQEQFLKILEKYRTGKATREETDLIKAYYNAFEFRPDILDSMSEMDQETLALEIKRNIDEQAPEKAEIVFPSAQRKLPVWSAYAAAVLVLLVSAFVFFRNTEKAEPEVVYVKSEKKVSKPNNFVQLPDGSTVILTAGSKIDYPDSFDNKKKREVYLSGEAYFDIQRNPAKPFIVHAGKLSTTVLGTAFNIRAWPGDESITVTVTRGRVKVSDQNKIFGTLIPDQQITYNTVNHEAVQQKVNAEKTVEWKSENLLFDDVTVFNAAKLIEERFSVKIRIDGERLKTQRFTTTFGKDETLESVLKSITEFNDARYELDPINKAVIISPN
ncbi:FecR family protein [Dyadobacter sp. CY323]|uniref:FecR family protein n=1 Tax=Dyadobacter sp. CY323 TaxID=2907302 RepID=UPI001F2128FE|nr:FecR domain-containing protein [Dyadobacter sp. CY323]MCE6989772.1 FecR domain-containing protein [Dyadobacter sp. CY323]